jgi:hypothetical protein
MIGKRQKNTSTLFYHIHVPRTGGSTVANLLVADICKPDEEDIKLGFYKELCTRRCEMALVESQFTCIDPKRIHVEHSPFSVNLFRSESLKVFTGAQNLVYVTTLRRGSDRVLSQWSHESAVGLFIPPPGVQNNVSNESLQVYLQGGINGGGGWHGSNSPSQRNNLAVAQLSSMNNTSPENVTREHLEEAKRVLMTGTWLIGFTDCMDKVHERLTQYGDLMFGSTQHKIMPKEVTEYSSTGQGFVLNEKTSAMLQEYTSLDNELFEWAWKMAETGTDPRFAGTC